MNEQIIQDHLDLAILARTIRNSQLNETDRIEVIEAFNRLRNRLAPPAPPKDPANAPNPA